MMLHYYLSMGHISLRRLIYLLFFSFPFGLFLTFLISIGIHSLFMFTVRPPVSELSDRLVLRIIPLCHDYSLTTSLIMCFVITRHCTIHNLFIGALSFVIDIVLKLDNVRIF